MSVNRPTNVKQKEQDVNQKLQLYGILTGKSHSCARSSSSLINCNLANFGFAEGSIDELIGQGKLG